MTRSEIRRRAEELIEQLIGLLDDEEFDRLKGIAKARYCNAFIKQAPND